MKKIYIAKGYQTGCRRFLRARGFNIAAAQKQFTDAENWRKKHDVHKLYRGMSVEIIEQSRRFYPRWTGRRDKVCTGMSNLKEVLTLLLAGHPIIRVPPRFFRIYPTRIRLHSIRDKIPTYVSLPQKSSLRSTSHVPTLSTVSSIALNELMIQFTFPLCSHLPHVTSPIPISSTTTIIDLENVSFSSMWRLRHHLQEASSLSTANYPETLHSIAIVNSPSFFPTIWNWIKVGQPWICVVLLLKFVYLRAGSTKAPA